MKANGRVGILTVKANDREGILTVKANGRVGILTDKPFLHQSTGSAWGVHFDMCIMANVLFSPTVSYYCWSKKLLKL